MPTKRHGRGGAPAMWGRAEEQVGGGAEHLFARLGSTSAQRAECITALERLAGRMRAGEWNDALAALAAQALALEAALRKDERADR